MPSPPCGTSVLNKEALAFRWFELWALSVLFRLFKEPQAVTPSDGEPQRTGVLTVPVTPRTMLACSLVDSTLGIMLLLLNSYFIHF